MKKNPVHLLVRSSWQTVNIGDIAHTPGILTLLERHLPEVEVHLWPANIDSGVEALLRKRFPKVHLVLDEGAVAEAFQTCDFMLHGSGPYLVADKQMARWVNETKKPWGVYGITLPSDKHEVIPLLNTAQFVFFRDTVSLELARRAGCLCPVMSFGPDAAFATDLADEGAAAAYLKVSGLESGKFLTCIPKYRHTPYWKIHERPMTELDHQQNARSQIMKEHDHRPLREAILAVVTETDMKVLVCPEDRSQMAIGKEMLVDPLPASVKDRVVWRPDYWLTAEARSVYLKSAGYFGLEQHTPILYIGAGIPAVLCRFVEQTTKAFMWKDIGLSSWFFDVDDEVALQDLTPRVLELARKSETAWQLAKTAKETVEHHQKVTMAHLGKVLDNIR